MATPLLGFTHLEENSDSPEIRVNELADNAEYSVHGYVAVNFSSDGDLTLSTTGDFPRQWQYGYIKLTDTGVVLTGAANVIVPALAKRTVFRNATAQDLTVKTSGGTGVVVAAGEVAGLQCDGTNVISADGGGGSFLSAVVDDTSPQLGGQLDVNGQAIGDGTLELLTFTETGSAVNQVNVTNAATGNAPSLTAAGDDTDIDLNLDGKGTGQVQISGAFKLPTADGSSGQALVTDGSGGVTWGAPSGSASVLDMPSVSKTANYTVVSGDAGKLILADATSGAITLTLPAAATVGDSFTLAVKKVDASNNVVIDGNASETIDGAATYTLTTQYDTVLIQCDGTGWNVLTEPASGTTDANAIHDNTASEISAITEKTTLDPDDWLLMEDSEDSNAKKAVKASTLLNVEENAQTGTTYTLVADDALKLVTMNNAASNTLTVPPNSSVAFPVGTQLIVMQKGAGQTTVAQGSGVTINKSSTLLLRAQYSMVTLIKLATDTWYLSGDTE